ncbi:hypothetical protein OROGR_029426 [Orobanche gracilis]
MESAHVVVIISKESTHARRNSFSRSTRITESPDHFNLIALRSCASATTSSGTSSSKPMIEAVESQDLGSGSSSSQPMIEVCMNPFVAI